MRNLSADQIEDRFNLACKQSNVFAFMNDVKLFPEGDQTVVGERGVKLSGG
jgi:ABC-type multidrug transport system fused ATPase/permease subunit